MAWHIFEKLMEGVATYSPLIGKIWITFLFMFRLIMVASIGDTVYSDEQSSFVCNTKQPGCANVCFNKFSPISHIRFWAVQILFVGTPSIMFIVYSWHKITKIPPSSEEDKQDQKSLDSSTDTDRETTTSSVRRRTRRKRLLRQKKSLDLPKYDEAVLNEKKWSASNQQWDLDASRTHDDGIYKIHGSYVSKKIDNRNNSFVVFKRTEKEDSRKSSINTSEKKRKRRNDAVKRKKIYNNNNVSEVVQTQGIIYGYVIQVFLRTGIEAVFLYLQYDLFKFRVPARYECTEAPCPLTVECFVSRPMEKTLFLLFMYVMTCLSLLLNVIEIFTFIYKWIKRITAKSNNKMESAAKNRLPVEQIVIHRSRDGQAVVHNTYPVLGPFPRKHNNSFGDSSGNETMESDYRYYDS